MTVGLISTVNFFLESSRLRELNNHLIIGILESIIETGSNDVYVVGSKGQAQQILVPALKTVVTSIDLDAGKMTVALPEVDE